MSVRLPIKRVRLKDGSIVTDPYQSFTCLLDNEYYKFTLRWNNYGEFWVLSIPDQCSVKVLCGFDLFGQFHHLLVPPGILEAVPTSTQNKPSLYELGDFTNLIYTPVEEL